LSALQPPVPPDPRAETTVTTGTGDIVPIAPAKGPIVATATIEGKPHVVVEVISAVRALWVWALGAGVLDAAYEALSPIAKQLLDQANAHQPIDWKNVALHAVLALFFYAGMHSAKNTNKVPRA
jgi:hypothetical protein